MEDHVRILGLGIKFLAWQKLLRQLGPQLETQGYALQSQYLAETWGAFLPKALSALDRLQPDLVLASSHALGGLAGVQDFYRELSQQEATRHARLILVEKSPHDLLEQLLAFEPQTRFTTRHLGQLRLDHAKQLRKGHSDKTEIAIEPAPRIHIKSGAAWAPGDEFLPLEAMDKVIWKGEEMQPKDFLQFQCYVHQEAQPLTQVPGLIKRGSHYFLKHRIEGQDILRIQAPRLELFGLWSYDQLKTAPLRQQLLDLAKACLVRRWVQTERQSLNYVKAFTPLTVISSHRLAAKMFAHCLGALGFAKVETSPSSPYRLLVFLNPANLGECPHFLDLSNEIPLKQALAMPDLGEAYLKRSLPPEKEMPLSQIEEERTQVKQRIHLLFERQKRLTSKKVIAEQERDLIEMAHHKTSLLLQLAQKISLLEETEPDPNYDALVFYDDPAVAGQISRRLHRGGRNLFVDLGTLETLDDLLHYDTQAFESYLQHGKVYASSLSQKRLVHLMKAMLEEIPPLDDNAAELEEKSLEMEGTALDQALDELSYLHLWNISQELAGIYFDLLLSASARALPAIEEEVFKLSRPAKLAVLSADPAREAELRSFGGKLMPRVNKKAIAFLSPPLKLQAQLEDLESAHIAQLPKDQRAAASAKALAKANILAVKEFLAQATYDLVLSQADFLILELEMELALPLVESLRKTSQQGATPILVLAKGWVNQAATAQLVDRGARVVYAGEGTATADELTSRCSGILD